MKLQMKVAPKTESLRGFSSCEHFTTYYPSVPSLRFGTFVAAYRYVFIWACDTFWHNPTYGHTLALCSELYRASTHKVVVLAIATMVSTNARAEEKSPNGTAYVGVGIQSLEAH
jgi:hypothetical protein